MARKKKTEIEESLELTETLTDNVEVTENIKNTKRILKSVNTSKDFEYIPKDEIDSENPIKFKFKMCSNSETAMYNDALYKAEGTKIITCQNAVDLQMVKGKVYLIQNVLIDDNDMKDIILKNDIKDFFENTCPAEWISDLASFIRVISAYKGEI